MNDDWPRKTFVVTGAASGIGAAIARLLKTRGACVIALDRRWPGDDASDEFIEFDQGDEKSITDASAQIRRPVDGLFNVAGVPPSPRISAAELLNVNFFGLRLLTEQIAPHLNAGSAVINMSSHAGWRWRENASFAVPFLALRNGTDIAAAVKRAGVITDGLGDRSAYPLSKQLLNLWTAQSAVNADARGIRMNAVSCAGVATPILDDFFTSFGEESAARIRAIGLAQPEDIAPALAFLASSDARWIKGAIIPVDGGASAMGALKALGL